MTLREEARAAIDLEEALLRVGDEQVLDELVALFLQTWRHGATRVRTALAEGGAEKARAVVHSLWGVTATLAIRSIRDSAARLDDLLRAGEPAHQIEAELAQLEAAITSFAGAVDGPGGAG